MTTYEEQVAALHKALSVIARVLPDAIQADVSTSDQGFYGFVLDEIHLPGGVLLSEQSDATLVAIANEVHDLLCDLDWDGAVGENGEGYASIPLGEPEGEGDAAVVESR